MIRLQAMLLLLMAVCAFTFSGATPSYDGAAAPSKTDQAYSQEGEKTRVGRQYEQGVLLALVETQEEAERITELYGIELVSVEGSLAKFFTGQDIMELIELGETNGWPPVQPNYLYRPF